MGQVIQRLAADAKGQWVKCRVYAKNMPFLIMRAGFRLRESGLWGFKNARVNIYAQNFGLGVRCGFFYSVRVKYYKGKGENLGFWAKEEVTS